MIIRSTIGIQRILEIFYMLKSRGYPEIQDKKGSIVFYGCFVKTSSPVKNWTSIGQRYPTNTVHGGGCKILQVSISRVSSE